MTRNEVRLGDLVPATVLVNRGFPTQRAQTEGDVRVLSVAALRSGTPPKHHAAIDDLTDLGLDVARPGDVLVAIEGGTIGEAIVVAEGEQPFVPSQQVATIRVVDTGILDPWYLGAWFSTDIAVEQLRRLARGAGIQRIAMKELDALILNLPPMAVQREIGDRYRAFDRSIRLHREITACLEELRTVDLAESFDDLARGASAPAAKPSNPKPSRTRGRSGR